MWIKKKRHNIVKQIGILLSGIGNVYTTSTYGL